MSESKASEILQEIEHLKTSSYAAGDGMHYFRATPMEKRILEVLEKIVRDLC